MQKLTVFPKYEKPSKTEHQVADPTEGFGIFIENMLNSVNVTQLQKAA